MSHRERERLKAGMTDTPTSKPSKWRYHRDWIACAKCGYGIGTMHGIQDPYPNCPACERLAELEAKLAAAELMYVCKEEQIAILRRERDEARGRLEKAEGFLRECLGDYGHPAFTDRHGMADRLRSYFRLATATKEGERDG